jgi:hypothetical protein
MNKLKSIVYLQRLLYGWVFISCFLLQNVYASDNVVIQQITLDSSFGHYIKTVSDIQTPFFLDTKGHVWACEMPLIFEEPLQIPVLKDIVHIAPFIAVDSKGDVYTWGFKIKLLVPEEVDAAFDHEVSMSYSPAKKVEGLKDIVYVAYNAGHFAAIDKAGKIYHWYALNESEQIIINGKADYPQDYVKWRNSIHWDGINTMDYSTMRVIESDKEAVKVAINYRGVLALNKDGSVYGWGISSSGQEIVSNEPLSNDVTFYVDAALHVTDIALNPFHTAFISDGKAHFYGGCDLGGRDIRNGKPWTPGVLMDHVIPLENLKSFYLTNNDNEQPDTFIDVNGYAWKATPPQPSGVTVKERNLCDFWASHRKDFSKGLYETLSDEPPYKAFKEKQFEQANESCLLDKNGEVWCIDCPYNYGNFPCNRMTFQKADFNHNLIK